MRRIQNGDSNWFGLEDCKHVDLKGLTTGEEYDLTVPNNTTCTTHFYELNRISSRSYPKLAEIRDVNTLDTQANRIWNDNYDFWYT